MADKKISQLTGATTPLAGTEVLPIVQGGSTVKVSAANITAGRTVAAKDVDLTVTASSSADQLALKVTNAGENGATFDVNNAFGPLGQLAVTKKGAGNQADDGKLVVRLATNSVLADVITVSETGNQTLNTGNLVVGTAGKGIDFSANTHAAGMTSELLNWYEEGTWTPQISSGATDATMGADNVGRYTRIGRVVFIHAFVQTSSVAGIGGGEIQIKNLPFAPNSGYAGYAASCGGWAANLNISAGQVVSFRPNAGATTIQILLWDDAAGTTNMTGTEWSDDGYVSFSLSYMI